MGYLFKLNESILNLEKKSNNMFILNSFKEILFKINLMSKRCKLLDMNSFFLSNYYILKWSQKNILIEHLTNSNIILWLDIHEFYI